MTSGSSHQRKGALSTFARIFGPYLVGGLLVWAALTWACSALMIGDGDLPVAAFFGALLPATFWWASKTVGWWRAGLLPEDARERRWTTGPTWSDLVPHSGKDTDRMRRALCAETAFLVLIVVAMFAFVVLDGRVDAAVLVWVIGGAFAVVSLLWITLIAWGRPRWLLPAQYRHPERHVPALSVVNAKTGKRKSGKTQQRMPPQQKQREDR